MTRLKEKMLKAFGVEVEVMMELISPWPRRGRKGEFNPDGQFQRFFRPPPPKEPTRPYVGPLALPLNPRQCAHVDEVVETLAEGDYVTYVRCQWSAKHGFLCWNHDRLLLDHQSVPIQRDFHGEVIDSIMLTERKALKGLKREVVDLGKGKSITFVDGLHMHTDCVVPPDADLAPEGMAYGKDDPVWFGQESR